MVDTIASAWPGRPLTTEQRQEWRERYPLTGYREIPFYQGQRSPWVGLDCDTPFGRVLYGEGEGVCRLKVEGSLGKYLHGSNDRLLTRTEAEEGYRHWKAAIEEEFVNVIEGAPELRRVDFYHQAEVGFTGALVEQLRRCFTNQTSFDSGLWVKHNKLHLTRFYDKGQESGNEQLVGVFRHEEQLRKGRKGLGYMDPGTGAIDVDGVVGLMNGNIGRACFVVRQEVRDLARQGVQGLALLALFDHPEALDIFQESVSPHTFRKYRDALEGVVQQLREVDLRVSADSWAA